MSCARLGETITLASGLEVLNAECVFAFRREPDGGAAWRASALGFVALGFVALGVALLTGSYWVIWYAGGRDLCALALEAQNAAIETMKSGAILRDGHQAVYDVFKKYGVAQYGYGNAGHSVGLSIHDPNGYAPGGCETPFDQVWSW